MGVSTNMFMQVNCDTEENTAKAFEAITKYKEENGRTPMIINDCGTHDFNVEDFYDRRPNDEYFKGLLKLFKGFGVKEVNLQITQVVDSFCFEGNEEFEEFLEEGE